MTNSPETMTNQATSPLESKLAIGANDQPTSSPFDLNKAAVLDVLKSAGITEIIVYFDGYGDSGQIGEISVSNADGLITMPELMVEIIETTWPQTEPRPSSVSIASAVETMAYDVLEQTHCGWGNDDGAYGNIVFDVAARTITLDYNERYTESENFTHIL